MPNSPSQPPFASWQTLTPAHKRERALALFLAPALTVMVFMRRRVGLRLLRPDRVLSILVALQLYANFGVTILGGTRTDIISIHVFSAAFALAAIAHYCKAWRGLNRGMRSHTYSSGISPLASGRLPSFLLGHRRVYRILDPLVAMAVSTAIFAVWPFLGLWLMVSAFCFRLFEQALYEAALERDMDIGDSLCEAEIQQQTVEHYSTDQPATKRQRRRVATESQGIPTGLAPDIEEHMARRRARK